MENTCLQYENSLTRQAEESMDIWTKELADMSEELMNDPMAVVRSLNDARNLCTAGFLMRRQIQASFSELLRDASEETGESYEDLTVNNNVPWPEKFLKNLSSRLEKYMLKEQNEVVKAIEWFQWLSDKKYPRKRELAVKLSFLLNMDDYTTTKFLLACGHEPFSVRNPLDCICLFCKMLRPQGELYKITGKPIGEGGGSIVYPCKKISYLDGKITVSEIDYALKECFPLSAAFVFERREDGEIVSASEDPASVRYLDSVKKMQMQEQEITGKIYNTAARTIPVISASGEVELSFDEGHTFHLVNNTVTIMTSLESKGKALKSYLSQGEKFSVVQAFQIIKQVLFAVKEVHEAGFLHLDIQDGNVFIKGSLSEEDNLVSLVDFGAARPVCEDGLCPVIRDRALFSTMGFESPEIVGHNDGTLRLGAEADLYSVGYLLLLMLTGKRYTQRELDSANIGLYLSKRKLKKLNCPAHMADKVHQIISKALKKTPEDRYHSCEEMLADVSDLLHALQPYKSDLSQVVYDAFICYRHGETDSQAAKILQQKLEHFYIPWMRKNKIKKIRRVFMDEGELSSCSDFGLQIREALKNSGWLIVICSSETKDSPWVNLEIKTFLEFHDRSRILAVVTEGEPEDVFPKELLGSDRTAEVLAADARGETPEQVLRNVKKNVLLKIAAPILGTTYDSLKQRQRNYIIKKYAVIGSLAVLMANAFFLFAMDRNHRIEEQNRRIMENRAEDQVALSAELLKEGNREEALQAALEAQEEGDTPVIPEEIYALNSALYSYHHEGNVEGFRPDRQVELENNTTDIGESSPDGKVFFCLDESGIAYFYNMEDWSLKWKCKLEEETSAFIDGKFVSEGKILLFSQNTAYYTDIEQQKCIKRIPLKEEDNMLETPVWALHDGCNGSYNFHRNFSGRKYSGSQPA